MKLRKNLIVAASIAMCVAGGAQAQMSWYPPIGIWPGNLMFNAQRSAEHFAQNSTKETRLEFKDRSDAAGRVVSESSLIFRTSPTLRRQHLASFVQKARAVDAQGAAGMQQLFATTDVLALADAQMRKMGLSSNNVADAFALWWGTAWLATKGRDDDLAAQQVQAISRQAATGILSSPEFVRASDAQKQEMAEALVVQTMLISASLEMAKEQPSMMPGLKAAVAKGARATGINLSTMTLTDEGFRPARGSDASDAPLPLGTVQERQADARGSDAGPNYLLMAGVGGAGFAGVYLLGKRSGRKG